MYSRGEKIGIIEAFLQSGLSMTSASRWLVWIRICEKYGITRSMSKKGCSPDNSAMEGFFGRLKVEMLYGESWAGWSVGTFMGEVEKYIRWYYEERVKQSLGGTNPCGYRQKLGIAA